MARKLSLVFSILVILTLGLGFNTTAVSAASYTIDPSTPGYLYLGSFTTCAPSDVFTISLPENATAYYYFVEFVNGSNVILKEGWVPAGGLTASFPYPTITSGSHEFRVDVHYNLGDGTYKEIYVKWMVTCEPPTPTPTPPPAGFEGCTPGYWRNHLQAWPATGYSTNQDFDTVFGVNYFATDITLGQAIKLGGGGYNVIARHGTAALLSASHSGVNYPYTVAEVIAFVKANNASALEAANELGCPLN